MPTRIDAAYKVVTPMFSGGADPARAELRMSSFKGVLRYWWRALAWEEHGGDLEEIRRREDELFGSARDGQSMVTMRLDSEVGRPATARAKDILRIPDTTKPVGEGVRYLGYGVMEAFPSRKKGTRECLQAPCEFTIRMRVRDLERSGKRLTPGGTDLLRDALIATGVFGGMGAKSRKGFGSVVLRSLMVDGKSRWAAPRSKDDLEKCVARLRRTGVSDVLPEYTALSDRARHVLVWSDSHTPRVPLTLLDLIGRELIRYRSWGRGGRILQGMESERNFEDDHDLMKMQYASAPTHPRRVAFGLPHNYGPRREHQVGPADHGLDRRASPLFIHIHECGDKPVAVLSFLPARFLPEGKSGISVGGRRVEQRPEDELYRPVHGFLDRLLQEPREALTAIEVGP